MLAKSNLNAKNTFMSFHQKIEESLDRGGLPGRQCVLRAICELKETPIHEWSLVGEMIANFML